MNNNYYNRKNTLIIYKFDNRNSLMKKKTLNGKLFNSIGFDGNFEQ